MNRDIPVPESAAGFIGEAVLERIRAGTQPNAEVARGLNTTPLIDILRRQVAVADVPWLLRSLRSPDKDPATAAFCLSLLRAFSAEPAVREALREIWESSDPALRGQLLWRLLDDPDLPVAWQQRLRAFVMENLDVFSDMAFFYREGLPGVERRLADPSFPSSKRWAYLAQGLVLLASTRASEARRWLAAHTDGLDEAEKAFLSELLEAFSNRSG